MELHENEWYNKTLKSEIVKQKRQGDKPMEFYKFSGAGNDFLVLNNMTGAIDPAQYAGLARLLCRRRFSVGADGLMVVEPSESADFRMAFYNADGSTGEMCGNGARCICRFGYEVGLAGETQRVETPSGVIIGRRLDARRYRIRLTDPTLFEACRPAEGYDCAYVELGCPGLPHAVVEQPGLASMTLEELRPLGKTLRWNKEFPKGANANFYELMAPDRAVIRTYERGVEDFTLACGTGSAATALTIARRAGKEDMTVYLENPGGLLEVELCPVSGSELPALYLTGPADMVARGEILDEDFHI